MSDCRVYWGSHGCKFERGHAGDCWCSCCQCANHPDQDKDYVCVAGPPYYGEVTTFYGEDAEARGLPVFHSPVDAVESVSEGEAE